MHRGSCYGCTYFREEKCGGGTVRPYCNDKDCTVDPYDPECNYND
jgi:hypothetical protein